MQIKNISDKDNISLDNVCYLISETVTRDEMLVEQITKTEKLCYCAESAVYSNEFYKAGQQGIEANKLIIINSEEYSDELKVKYEEKEYSVYRTFPRADGLAELYLTFKAGG